MCRGLAGSADIGQAGALIMVHYNALAACAPDQLSVGAVLRLQNINDFTRTVVAESREKKALGGDREEAWALLVRSDFSD